MTPSVEAAAEDDSDWPRNYFNYFTETEEHFQRARGTGLFLLSPLDWALIESWKISGIPLEAVLKGIDDAFEKWRSSKSKRRSINSLAYCAQAVLEAAQRVPSAAAAGQAPSAPLFPVEELRAHLDKAADALRQRADVPLQEVADSLQGFSGDIERHAANLEAFEQKLTAMEEKVIAALRVSQSDEDLFAIREALDRELKPYRGKMTADQLAMLERRYIDTALLERAKLPRLSLFYLH
jgi:DNA repair ATPase RecN